MALVAIVGRPNVGKSTLFNRLTRKGIAIIEDTPGVTRDRIFGESEWRGVNFTVVDTGGFVPKSENLIEKAVSEQVIIAIEEADVILFVCDVKTGITAIDYEISDLLRKSNKPVMLLVNKCDTVKQDLEAYEFHNLALGQPYPISSASGRNTSDFLDDLVELLPKSEKTEEDKDILKIAIVGRPNVGKSSMVNALVGKKRAIVTEIPGTTRDSIDTKIHYNKKEIILIDTAGLRRRSHIKENIEFFSTLRTHRAIKRCDVAVVVLDATEGLLEQDKKIINLVDEERKGLILAYNKWDLVQPKDDKTADKFKKQVYDELQSYYWAPIVFVSAMTKQRLPKLLDLSFKIQESRKLRIPTAQLNRDLLPELEHTPPPAVRGRDLRINYITQTRIEPPLFVFFCNFPDLIPDSYKRFIERKLREKYDFEGVPISFLFRKKHKDIE